MSESYSAVEFAVGIHTADSIPGSLTRAVFFTQLHEIKMFFYIFAVPAFQIQTQSIGIVSWSEGDHITKEQHGIGWEVLLETRLTTTRGWLPVGDSCGEHRRQKEDQKVAVNKWE